MKKLFNAILVILLFCLFSCTNMINEGVSSSKLSFNISEDTSRYINDTLRTSKAVTDDTKLVITCTLFKDTDNIKKIEQETTLVSLDEQKFIFDKLPYYDKYKIAVSIKYNDIEVFTALSSFIALSEETNDITIDLTIKPKVSTISYETNGGNLPSLYPTSYFITSSMSLPIPTKEHSYFVGWTTKDGDKVDKLGRDNFLGDVTLYATWETIASVTFSKTGEVDAGDKISLSCQDSTAKIYYTTNGSTPTTSSILYDNKEQITINDDITITAIAIRDDNKVSKVTSANYIVKTYTVKFDNSNHGTKPQDIPGLKKGSTLTKEQLKSLEEENFEFLGWYVDDEKVDESYVINSHTTITAKWKDILAPGNVTKLKATPNDGSVNLSWTDPTDADLATVKISYNLSSTAQTKTVNKGVQTATITGLTNGTKYTFTVSTIDTTGNESSSALPTVECFANPRQSLTTSMKSITHTGVGGVTGNYVIFGDYPQTVKSSDVTIDETQSTTKVNNMDCYIGNDNCYYVKVASAKLYSKQDLQNHKFSNGENVQRGKPYYFKVEPIIWRVLTDNFNGNNLLLCDNSIDCKRFDAKSQTYENSEIDTFLNEDFINNSFTSAAKTQLVSNNGNKAFLLSKQDISNIDYGFSSDLSTKGDSYRKRLTTDYAIANGIFYYDEKHTSEEFKATIWWLKDANTDSGFPGTINVIGGKGNCTGSTEAIPSVDFYGNVPAIVVGTAPQAVISDFTIPKAGLSHKGRNLTFNVYGSFFQDCEQIPTVSGISGATATIKTNNRIEVTLPIPAAEGNTTVTVSSGSISKNATLSVKDYSKLNLTKGYAFLNDGTVAQPSEANKANVLAIFYGCYNEYGAPLGVGLQRGYSLAFANKPSLAYETCIVENYCTPSAKGANTATNSSLFETVGEQDFDGSDNFEGIVSKYEQSGKTRQDAITDSPLFSFSEQYGTSFHLPLEYSKGWYIPSLKELADLYKEYTYVNDSITTSGGTVMNPKDVYWSSSQDKELKDAAYVIGFNNAHVLNQFKDYPKNVRVIRAF